MDTSEVLRKMDLPFLKSFLSQVTEVFEKIPENIDTKTASFLCQLAAGACCQQFSLLTNDINRDSYVFMNLVVKLWPTTPIGAKEHLDKNAWGALFRIPWNERNAAWHNLLLPSSYRSLKKALEEIFSFFPLLKESDFTELAEASPVLKYVREKNRIDPSYSPYFSFELLDAHHQSQITHCLGYFPKIDLDLSMISNRIDGEAHGSFTKLFSIVDKAGPVFIAHLEEKPEPPRISHSECFLSIIRQDPFMKAWEKTIALVKRDGKDIDRFKEVFLEHTYLASYQAAYDLMNCSEFIDAAAKRGPGIRATSDFQFQFDPDFPQAGEIASSLIFLVDEYYKSSFPNLTDSQVGMLLYRNPLFIYLENLRVQGTHAIEGKTSLDTKDNWDE